MKRFLRAFPILLCILWVPMLVRAEPTAQAPAQVAERMRVNLFEAQQLLLTDQTSASAAVAAARVDYTTQLEPIIQQYAPQHNQRILAGFHQADSAIASNDPLRFASARSQIWTAVLAGSCVIVLDSVEAGDTATARQWLPVREFRHATRFSRPNADATRALLNLSNGSISSADALLTIRNDLYDTYQARMQETLALIDSSNTQGFATRVAEHTGLVQGYALILAPAYEQQRGSEALTVLQQALTTLDQAGRTGEAVAPALTQVTALLKGFRAAPLSQAEQARRAGQLLRFLSLVPVEYTRGIHDGQVVIDLEIREALTFYSGAETAFSDLEPALAVIDSTRTAGVARQLEQLGGILRSAGTQTSIADPAQVTAISESILNDLRLILPQEWQLSNSSADFDVIASALDQMEQAVRSGDYQRAESARLEAYAIMEVGPEAKLIAFAPQYKPLIEGYFWYGQETNKGLAYLIEHQAPLAEISATRKQLGQVLADAEQALAGNNAPTAVATNAGVIVFREGLEAVLILASLLGSLKIGTQRRFRQPIWIGTALAFVATVITWVVAHEALMAMARFGEKLEAVVSLIAIGVLLLITNWFFHDIYWKGWMSNFHQQKRRILTGQAGQWVGLITLGFASIYREGFETVLFLQALVLEGGAQTVLIGVAIGLTLTLLVGLAVFGLQAKLPHKKMLIVTGILIGAVLLQMVGNTVNVLQVVGWLPLHPIRWLELPYWAGFWLGLYPTWEGIALQAAAAIFVIGSYYLAEHFNRREQQATPQSGGYSARIEA